MEPKKLTQLERDMLEECARTHEAIHPGPLLAHIAAVEAERDEASTKVAQLHASMEDYASARDMLSELLEEHAPAIWSQRATINNPGGMDWRGMLQLVIVDYGTNYPATRDALREAVAERDEAREQAATARADALEEAAARIDCGCGMRCTRNEAAAEIRVLATTPPPPVVPVAKVQSVARKLLNSTSGDDGYDAAWNAAVFAMVDDLEVGPPSDGWL